MLKNAGGSLRGVINNILDSDIVDSEFDSSRAIAFTLGLIPLKKKSFYPSSDMLINTTAALLQGLIRH